MIGPAREYSCTRARWQAPDGRWVILPTRPAVGGATHSMGQGCKRRRIAPGERTQLIAVAPWARSRPRWVARVVFHDGSRQEIVVVKPGSPVYNGGVEVMEGDA